MVQAPEIRSMPYSPSPTMSPAPLLLHQQHYGASLSPLPQSSIQKGKSDITDRLHKSQLLITLTWNDFWVTISNKSNGRQRHLLHGMTGYAEPGHIMAIMGPSGSGKSILLDTLAGINFFSLKSILINHKKTLNKLLNTLWQYTKETKGG